MALQAGDWVEVRSKEEILRSLDSSGRLDNMPFMPQMFDFCGRRFRVYKRAHKTCDTINFAGGRKLADGIHLENLRCDGQAYGGCQAACLIFWKETWLKPVDGGPKTVVSHDDTLDRSACQTGCSEAGVLAGTHAKDQPASGGPRYACQATELLDFTRRLRWWDMRQYLEDYTSGNAPLSRLASGAIYASYFYFSRPGRNRLRKPFRSFYDMFQRLRGGVPFPRYSGVLSPEQTDPGVALDLQPGELVRVKSYEDILATVDTTNKNRGLYFDAEMVPYCGRTFRVRSRVSRFVNEKTGCISKLRTPAVILEDVWCNARYSGCRMHCPRSVYPWWRETWLERVAAGAAAPGDAAPAGKVGAARAAAVSAA